MAASGNLRRQKPLKSRRGNQNNTLHAPQTEPRSTSVSAVIVGRSNRMEKSPSVPNSHPELLLLLLLLRHRNHLNLSRDLRQRLSLSNRFLNSLSTRRQTTPTARNGPKRASRADCRHCWLPDNSPSQPLRRLICLISCSSDSFLCFSFFLSSLLFDAKTGQSAVFPR